MLGSRKKLDTRKMLENAAESHTSDARFVGQPAYLPERWLLKCYKPDRPNELGNEQIFQMPFSCLFIIHIINIIEAVTFKP